MGFYNERVVPHLVAFAMRNGNLTPYRERTLSQAEGRVLEVGIGAGANLPFYSARAGEIIGLEPSPRLVAMARRASAGFRTPVSLIEGQAEQIPVDAATVDTVVLTWTLCSIRDANRALAEMRRVLKPGGQLLFVEHGLAPDVRVRQWQDRLTPLWKRFAGGCHLNRAIDAMLSRADFFIEQLETGYMPGPRAMTFMYEGRARPG